MQEGATGVARSGGAGVVTVPLDPREVEPHRGQRAADVVVYLPCDRGPLFLDDRVEVGQQVPQSGLGGSERALAAQPFAARLGRRHCVEQRGSEASQPTLDEIVVSAVSHGRHGRFLADHPRDDDERKHLPCGPHHLQSLAAGELRQVVIGQHRVPAALGEGADQLAALLDTTGLDLESFA